MPDLLYPDLDTYRREVFAPEDDLLRGIMPAAVAQGLPKISVSPESGKTLYLLAKMIHARKILEFGALAGYSGIWLARALPPDGRFITLEINPKHAEVTRANYKAAGLADRTEVRVGPAVDHLQAVEQEAPFDLVFIDADKESYPTYLDFALGHTRPGGLIIADNANGHGHVHEALKEGDGPRGIQVYNERVARHPGLVSNILPVGGWLAVSLVL
ncbi:MAG: O-methyltransferase [Candidatus Latescibacteria bacterium]|nr:O-methyltransferase [Candidatus Latescibacterota bacterium]